MGGIAFQNELAQRQIAYKGESLQESVHRQEELLKRIEEETERYRKGQP